MGVSLWQAVQNSGWVVPETARGLGAARLCAQLVGACRGPSSCSLEMPGGSGQGTGIPVTLQTVDLEWFLTAAL